MPECTAQTLLLDGQAGAIETRIDCPQSDKSPLIIAIICHPHPLHGGSMDNKVVYMLNSALKNAGAITARFNFRGVGKSAGSFDHGIGETEDLYRVTEYLQQAYPQAQLWLAGFSFGSYVAFRAHFALKPQRLLLVAPPVQRFAFAETGTGQLLKQPTLVIQGGKDDVVDPESVKTWIDTQQRQSNALRDILWLEEAGHFFHGLLIPLRESVQQWLEK